MIQSQLPELSLYRAPVTHADTVASDTPAWEETEPGELKFPHLLICEIVSHLALRRDADERQRKAEKDDTDWKTVFCEEWTDSPRWRRWKRGRELESDLKI